MKNLFKFLAMILILSPITLFADGIQGGGAGKGDKGPLPLCWVNESNTDINGANNTWGYSSCDSTGAQSVSIYPGGYTPGKLVGANSNNATVIKNSAGKLGFVTASNINASAVYLKFYDKATAPDPSTDTPKLIFIIPGGATGAGTNQNIPAAGLDFANGISFILVTGIADTDNTSVSANQQTISYGYK